MHRFEVRALALGTAALAALAALSAPAAAATASFVPHRAVYEMTLAKAKSSRSVTSVDGRMVFEYKDVCDGWSIDYRSRLQLSFAEQGARELAWKYSSWEADDGTGFRWFLRRTVNGVETENLRGKAELTPGAGGRARFARPEEKTIELPADTLFPKAHSEALLAAARADERFLFRHLFDGTGDQDGLYAVNAVLLSDTSGKAHPLDSEILAGVASWRFALAYFPPGGQADEGTPESEQTLRLYANGVTTDLGIDYGDFAVEARITELERLPAPDCG